MTVSEHIHAERMAHIRREIDHAHDDLISAHDRIRALVRELAGEEDARHLSAFLRVAVKEMLSGCDSLNIARNYAA